MRGESPQGRDATTGQAFRKCSPPYAHGTSDPGGKHLFMARRGGLPAKAVQHTRRGHTLRVPGEADEGLRPLHPGQVHVPDGVRGSQAVARMDDALAVLAVPGRVRRPHGARRFRIGRGRSGQSDPLMAARMAFPQGISGAGATPEAVESCENTLAATPHRAFDEGGCSRHGACRRCATTHPPTVPPRRCRARG